MNLFIRNAILNSMNGAIAGAQDYGLGWAIASAAVSAFALSSSQAGLSVIPTSIDDAKQRDILPMFALGMAGWYAGRKLFPPPVATETAPVAT